MTPMLHDCAALISVSLFVAMVGMWTEIAHLLV